MKNVLKSKSDRRSKMGISIQDAIERAKLSHDNDGYLSQYMYGQLLSSLDPTDQHAFAMALVDNGVNVKHGSERTREALQSSSDNEVGEDSEHFGSKQIYALMKRVSQQFTQSPGGLWVPSDYMESPKAVRPEYSKPKQEEPSREESPKEVPQSEVEEEYFEGPEIQETTQDLTIVFDIEAGHDPEINRFLNFLPLDKADSQYTVGGNTVFQFSNLPKDSKITHTLDNLDKHSGEYFYAIRVDNATGEEFAYGGRPELMKGVDQQVRDEDILESVDIEPEKRVRDIPETTPESKPVEVEQSTPVSPEFEDKPEQRRQQEPSEAFSEAYSEFADTGNVEYVQEVLDNNNIKVSPDGKVGVYKSNIPGVFLEKGEAPGVDTGKTISLSLPQAISYFGQQVSSMSKEEERINKLQGVLSTLKNEVDRTRSSFDPLAKELENFTYSDKSRNPFISELGKYIKDLKVSLDRMQTEVNSTVAGTMEKVKDMLGKLDQYYQKQYDSKGVNAEILDALKTVQQWQKNEPEKFKQIAKE